MPVRRRSSLPMAVAVVGAVAVGVLVHEAAPSSSRPAAAPAMGVAHPAPPPSTTSPPLPTTMATTTSLAATDGARSAGPLGLADGLVPKGTTVFADLPAVTRLDPALLSALRRSSVAAASDHVTFLVTSGWRSAAYQEHLLQAAIARYGSAAEAARWVASPARSQHVSGHAVDLGPSSALSWLSRHGAAYGLCRIYANERWHYELRPEAVAHGCPPLYPDAAHDPRLQG